MYIDHITPLKYPSILRKRKSSLMNGTVVVWGYVRGVVESSNPKKVAITRKAMTDKEKTSLPLFSRTDPIYHLRLPFFPQLHLQFLSTRPSPLFLSLFPANLQTLMHAP